MRQPWPKIVEMVKAAWEPAGEVCATRAMRRADQMSKWQAVDQNNPADRIVPCPDKSGRDQLEAHGKRGCIPFFPQCLSRSVCRFAGRLAPQGPESRSTAQHSYAYLTCRNLSPQSLSSILNPDPPQLLACYHHHHHRRPPTSLRAIGTALCHATCSLFSSSSSSCCPPYLPLLIRHYCRYPNGQPARYLTYPLDCPELSPALPTANCTTLPGCDPPNRDPLIPLSPFERDPHAVSPTDAAPPSLLTLLPALTHPHPVRSSSSCPTSCSNHPSLRKLPSLIRAYTLSRCPNIDPALLGRGAPAAKGSL